MYRLVTNELYKLFHKRSTYITLGILLVFVVLTNVIYKDINSSNYIVYNDEEYLNYLEENIKSFNKTTGNMEEYIDMLVSYDEGKFSMSKDAWQVDMYYNVVEAKLRTYYSTLYVLKDETKALELKKEIDEEIKKLEEKDWEYFARASLKDIEENLASLSDLESEDALVLKYQKDLLLYRIDNNISYENNYLSDALESQKSLIYEKLAYEKAKTKEEKKNHKEGYANFMENEYIINNKVDTNTMSSTRGIIVNFFNEYMFLILVFVIMISGAIISDEFSKGTIKALLTIPYTRSKIFIAKLITIMLMIPFITLFLLIAQLIVGGIVFGFGSLSIPVIAYNFKINAIEVMPLFKHFGLSFICKLPMLLLLSTLAFSLSAIICNTAFAITITFCGYIGSQIINQFALMYELKFLNYFVTTNWDLTSFMFGGFSDFNIGLMQSIITCLIYWVIMIVGGIIVFKKKDIKNI